MRRRVLLLDDEPEIVFVAAEYLEALGWDALRCVTLAEAETAVARANALDAAVLDWVLSGSSARSLVGRLRARHPRCRVLLATGLGSDAVDERELGIPVIRKPYTMHALASRLDQLVGDQAGAR